MEQNDVVISLHTLPSIATKSGTLPILPNGEKNLVVVKVGVKFGKSCSFTTKIPLMHDKLCIYSSCLSDI